MIENIKQFFGQNKKPILIVLAVVLILIIILLSIPFGKEQKEQQPTSTIRGQELAEEPTIVQGELTEQEKQTVSAGVIAKNFAEIYGTYSNQSNFQNIEDVLPLASSAYRLQLQQFLRTSRQNYKPAESYEGVTTVVISTITESLDENAGTASMLLKTQRKESVGTQANFTLNYQDIRLTLVKEMDKWKVSNAVWIE